ncbi:MFS transporter [Streptomyces sp. NBC_01643]|nr:MFS transporter [Streptomyces sp. NBC_01643]
MTVDDTRTEPQSRVGGGWISGLVLANLGLYMAFLTPIQVLLAEQIDDLTTSGKEVALGWATGVGALVAVVANPVAGALSDRTGGRFGRRHPWIVGGALVGAVGLVVTAAQTTVVGVALGWCLAQLGLNAMLAGTNAVVPDQVPVRQRAAVSGFIGIPQTLGLVLGVLLVSVVVTGIASDRLGKRKMMVSVCSMVMAAGSLLLTFWHTWPAAMGAAVLLGLGYGIYVAVDQALITQVLPAAEDRAKDLGVINVANSAPQVLGPALAAPIVAYAGGYAGLYLASTVVTVVGGVLVWRIRSVR